MGDVDLIQELLAAGDQVVLRREAIAAQVADEVIGKALSRGRLHRLTRGAYTSARPTSVQEHRRLLSIAALRLYPDAQLVGSAAAAAWGLPITGVPAVRLDIARPMTHEVLTRELRIRPSRVRPQRSALGPADPPATALVQMAIDNGVRAAVPAIDAALHAGVVSQAELASAAEVVTGWPGSSRTRCALAWADGRSESVGESLTRVDLTAAGIRTTPQVVIRDAEGAFVARCDLGVDGTRVLIEFDGKVKYTDGGADALFAEKRREDRLRRLGYLVVRVVWADLITPGRLIALVREALSLAA